MTTTTGSGVVAGVDIGGTKTLAVAMMSSGEIVSTVRRPTRAGTAPALLASTIDVLGELAAMSRQPLDGFAAVGVGIPGLIDRRTGTVRYAVNLGLGDEPVDVVAHLRAELRAPVVVDNDVNVAAAGAAAALGVAGDLAYLSIGTGIAAGFVLGGRIRHGAHGAAGEIGHLPVDPAGPWCECGQRGCLEAVASGTAVVRAWAPGDATPSAMTHLLEAAAAGDEVAGAVRDGVARHLAWAVALVAQTVDPDVIVLGGGVMEAGADLLTAVIAALHERAATSPVVGAIGLAGRVALIPPDVPAGALGAALLARQVLTGEPLWTS